MTDLASAYTCRCPPRARAASRAMGAAGLLPPMLTLARQLQHDCTKAAASVLCASACDVSDSNIQDRALEHGRGELDGQGGGGGAVRA